VASQRQAHHVRPHRGGGAAFSLLGIEGAGGVHEQLKTTAKAGTSTGEHLVGRVPAMGGQTADPSPGALLRGLIHVHKRGSAVGRNLRARYESGADYLRNWRSRTAGRGSPSAPHQSRSVLGCNVISWARAISVATFGHVSLVWSCFSAKIAAS
jgi:hypothetical protein